MNELIRILLGCIMEFVPEAYREQVIAVAVPVYVGIILIFTFWLIGWFARTVYRALIGGWRE
ncbi:MAG: hypothetical protein IJ642_06035 [Oscillospiraceae bacterium]|nr:hypothetical protein [Oscillospiraceae bacterium]MBR1528841.1 hypothetical protein [Oscillospiraceae bacterium]